MTRCHRYLSQLSAYIDQELTGQQMYEIRNHVSECPDCAQELAVLRSIKRGVASALTAPEPPSDLLVRLNRATVRKPSKRIDLHGLAVGFSFAASLLILTFAVLEWMQALETSTGTVGNPVRQGSVATENSGVSPRSIPVTFVNAPE